MGKGEDDGGAGVILNASWQMLCGNSARPLPAWPQALVSLLEGWRWRYSFKC